MTPSATLLVEVGAALALLSTVAGGLWKGFVWLRERIEEAVERAFEKRAVEIQRWKDEIDKRIDIFQTEIKGTLGQLANVDAQQSKSIGSAHDRIDVLQTQHNDQANRFSQLLLVLVSNGAIRRKDASAGGTGSTSSGSAGGSGAPP